MSPLQAIYPLSLMVIFPLAWLGGGHTERAGVALFIPMIILAYQSQTLRIGDLLWGVALADLVLLIGLIWLALTRDRWWPLVAAAFQTLIMLVHIATSTMPDLSLRNGVGASWALNIIVLYCLLGGVLERILTGEIPASRSAIWTRVRRPPAS